MQTNNGVKNSDITIVLKETILEISQRKISPSQIKDDANLFEDCGIDSTAVVELILALEEKFNITIAEDEITVDLFQKLSKLTDFITTKVQENSDSQCPA